MSEVAHCCSEMGYGIHSMKVWKKGSESQRMGGIGHILPSFHEEHSDHVLNLAIAFKWNSVKQLSTACRAEMRLV